MKVRKIASINNNSEASNCLPTIATTILYNHVSVVLKNQTDTEEPVIDLKMPITLGQGTKKRPALIKVPIKTSVFMAQSEAPVSLHWPDSFGEHQGEHYALFLFRNQLLLVSTSFLDATSEEEAALLVKKQVYSEDSRLKRLKQEVEALEGAIQKSGAAKRTPISDVVKLAVYARDDGKCTRCGSSQDLQFDHIIPIAKGGSNSEQNIQILCEHCNLQKSDRIAF